DVSLDRVGVRREDDDAIRVPRVPDREGLPELHMVRFRILRDVRFEGDAGAFEEDHFAGPVVCRGVAIVRVIDPSEVHRDPNRVAPRRDVFEHPGIPDAFLAFPVRPVVVQVAELPDERALSNSRSADDRDTHARSSYAGSLLWNGGSLSYQ